MIGWLVVTPYVVLFIALLVLGFRLPKKGKGGGLDEIPL